MTISVPLATRALRIVSGEGNFPVPKKRREVNRRPAMTSSDIGSQIRQTAGNV